MNILKGNILLLLASFIWGTAFIAQTTGMDFVGPLTFTFARFFLGSLTILPLIFIFEKKIYIPTVTRAKTFYIICCTSLALGFGAVTQQYALLYTDVSNAAFITALYVPIVPVILTIFLKKSLHWSIWLAVSICLIGLYLLTSESRTISMRYSDIILILSAIFFAIQIILTDSYMQKNNPPFTFAFTQYFIIFLITIILAIIFEKPKIANISMESFEIFYAGVLSVGGAYTIQILAQKNTRAAPAAIILSMEAVFAAVAAWIIIDQEMPLIKILGCILIFIGIVIAQIFPLLKKTNNVL